MNKKLHMATIPAVLATSWVMTGNPISTFNLLGLAVGSFLGAAAPDWLEISRAVKAPPERGQQTKWVRKSVIPHRTFTHFWPIWVLLLGYSLKLVAYQSLTASHTQPPTTANPLAGLEIQLIQMISYAVAAFATGCLIHILTDLPNYSGIPVLKVGPTTKGNTSLKLWASNSGKNWITVLFVTTIALILLKLTGSIAIIETHWHSGLP